MTFEDSIHRVSLTGNEISSILYALEGWIQGNDEYNEGWDNTSKGGNLSLDIDNVFTVLEEVADNWKGEFEDPKVISSQELEGDISTIKDSDYAECVDSLVDRLKSTK